MTIKYRKVLFDKNFGSVWLFFTFCHLRFLLKERKALSKKILFNGISPWGLFQPIFPANLFPLSTPFHFHILLPIRVSKKFHLVWRQRKGKWFVYKWRHILKIRLVTLAIFGSCYFDKNTFCRFYLLYASFKFHFQTTNFYVMSFYLFKYHE